MYKAIQELKTITKILLVSFLLLAAAFGFYGYNSHDRTTSLGSPEQVVQVHEPIQKQKPVLVQDEIYNLEDVAKKTDSRKEHTIVKGDTFWIVSQKYKPNDVETKDYINVLHHINKVKILHINSKLLLPNANDLRNVTLPNIEVKFNITDLSIINHLKQVEGSSDSQRVMKRRLLNGSYGPSFKNGKFYPYKDSTGHYTIGYGHYLGKGVSDAIKYQHGITKTEAHNMLLKDMQKTMNDFVLLLQRKRASDLTLEQQRLLYEMAFTMGCDKLSKFEKMWRHTDNTPKFKQEVQNSLWYKQVGNRADMLLSMVRHT